MKKLRILKRILQETGSDKILLGYLVFILADAFVIWLAEPGIDRYFDALWFCYEVISTTGFGEIVTMTFLGRVCAILLTIYSLLVIAIVTGVVTNFYMQLTELRRKDTFAYFMDKLERLPSLDKDELEKISEDVKKFRDKI